MCKPMHSTVHIGAARGFVRTRSPSSKVSEISDFMGSYPSPVPAFFLSAAKTFPHFGHRIRSESTRTISAGGIEYPHDGQIVFNAARTFARLILFFCTGEL
jgi:hypothetical protein